ncbi:MAG: SRPBCC family protein [Pseudonocardia sediminis]
MRVTLHARGPQPADEVWERYAVPARWPVWAPYILGVDASDDRIVTGTTGKVRGPLGIAVAFTVTAVDEDAGTWSWDVTLGPLAMTLDHGVAPDATGTRTWLTVDGPAAALVGYLPLARVSLEMLVRRNV